MNWIIQITNNGKIYYLQACDDMCVWSSNLDNAIPFGSSRAAYLYAQRHLSHKAYTIKAKL